MPLGPQNPEHSDPFAGSTSLEYQFPVTGGKPGTVTTNEDRNYVSSDPADKVQMVPGTQGELGQGTVKDPQHADAMSGVPGNMSQKPMPREGFTPAEVAEGLQLTQQEQHSFPRTQVEGLVEPLAAQGKGAASPVHSDVENEVPALKKIGVTVTESPSNPLNDTVHSDPFSGGEISIITPAAPTNLAVIVTHPSAYRMSFSWDAPVATDEVVAWELWEQDIHGNFNPVIVPHTYPWVDTTPNHLLDAKFVVKAHTNVLLDRATAGVYHFAVRAISAYGRYSDLSAPVTATLA